ncbi:MAG: TonB-dependent receptor, partial [Parapedobacter sp.]
MQMGTVVMTLLALISFNFISYAQEQITVTGTVLDSLDNIPLPGVTVSVEGATTSTKTNEDGEFSLNVPREATLVFAYLGYNTAYRTLQGEDHIDVRLSSAIQGLDEVVVVGYGQQKKISVTGAVSSVGNKEL